eukprot:3941606-Rhodomonas_salina.1
MSGTGLARAATECAVLAWRIVLPGAASAHVPLRRHRYQVTHYTSFRTARGALRIALVLFALVRLAFP